MILRYTVEFRRLDQCFIDMATAVVSEADRELTCMSPSSTAAVAQSMKHRPNLRNSPVVLLQEVRSLKTSDVGQYYSHMVLWH